MDLRQRKNKAKKNLYEAVGAQTRDELRPNEAREWRHWLNISGKHRDPNLQEYLFNFFLEFAGSFLLGLLVILVSAGSASGNLVLNGALTGITYALAYYFISRWSNNYALRRHLNWAVSFGYWWVGQIGLLGFLIYSSVQVLGALCAGAFISGINAIAVVTVPLPLTTRTSFSYALALEFLGSFVIVFSLLLNEFYATPGEDMPDGDAKAAVLGKNYKAATAITAGTKAVMVTAFYQMGSWSFSNVVYLSGLFSGFNHGGLRDVIVSSNLHTTDFATSVYTGGAAWVNYIFMPLLGSSAAAAVFWATLVMYEFRAKSALAYSVLGEPRVDGQKVPEGTDMVVPASGLAKTGLQYTQSYIEHTSNASRQQLAQPLISTALYKTQ